MRVCITAGHSNKDPGAIGNGYIEAEFAADMRNYVVHYLKEAGIEVVSDGTGRTNAPLKDAIVLANSADIAVEFHLNASSSPTPVGIEVLSQPKDKPFAQALANAIGKVTGSPLRGQLGWKAPDSGQHSRLGYVRAGGLIVELEFVSNKSAMAKLYDRRWTVAKMIANVIIEKVKQNG